MADPGTPDFAAEFLALRAANDQLRERGKQWLWSALDLVSGELSRERPGQEPLQVGRQDWEFAIGTATMVGERYGARLRGKTLLVEVGWPRLPEHGFVPDRGLARGRVSLSQNTMIPPRPIEDLILKRRDDGDPQWQVIRNRALGEAVTESLLRRYFDLLLAD